MTKAGKLYLPAVQRSGADHKAEFCAKLGHCTELGEAVGVQQDFARGVGGAYAAEAGKLSTLARTTMDAWTGASAQYVSNLTARQKKAA